MNAKIIPFDIELAKKIQSGEIEGRIVTEDGILVKLKVNSKYSERLITISRLEGYLEVNYSNIKRLSWLNYQNLFIELPEKTPEHEFKVGDKVVYAGIMGYITNINKNLVDIDPVICGIFHNIDISEIKLVDNSTTVETPKQKGELTLGKCKEGDEVWIFSNYEYGPKYVKVKVGKFSLDKSSGHRRNITFEGGFTCQELISETCWKEKPEDTPKHEFKPFDKVLVREDESDVWECRLFDRFFQDKGGLGYCCQDGVSYDFCIPYEGNEHLVGTTNDK